MQNKLSTRLLCFLADRGIKSSNALVPEVEELENLLDKVKDLLQDGDHEDEKVQELRELLGVEVCY